MGKGNKQVKAGEQTVINSLPDYARPYFENLMERSEAESLQQYQPYQGQRLVDSGSIADIATSRDMVRGIAGSGIPGMGEAMDLTRGAITGVGDARTGVGGAITGVGGAANQLGVISDQIGGTSGQVGDIAGRMGDTAGGIASLRGDVRGASQYDPTNFGQARQFTGAEVDKYMSPYMESVVNRQKDAAIRDFNRTGAARNAQAVQAGAFGGSRQGVADYLAQEGLQQQLGDIDATGRQQAFDQAARQFGADRAAQMDTMGRQEAANQFAQGQRMAGLGQEAGLFGQELGALGQQAGTIGQQAGILGQQAGTVGQQAGLFGQQANMFGQQAGLSGQQAQLGAGLAQLGGQERATGIQDAQLLEGIGKTQLGDQQAALDLGYQDFLNQQNFNKDQLGFFSNMLQGVPVSPNKTQQNFQPYNPMQQALGAGIAGLSLYRGLT